MSYYRHHVFFCTNQRADGASCCQTHGAAELRDYLKQQVKRRGLGGPGQIRINTAGCLDRCEVGPLLVVYPEAVWYGYVDREDLDEILERHLMGSEIVERLRIRP